MPSPPRAAFLGGLPERGPWTPVGLHRGQFLLILGVSVALFLLVGGPLWAQLRGAHLTRILVSYGVIPLGVVLALRRNGTLRLPLVAGATAVIALVKLLLTATLLVMLALAR